MAQAQTVGFEIETLSEIPAELKQRAKRGGRKGATQYPFDTLQVNQAFFVPVDAKKDEGNVEKTLSRIQSSISAARTRLNFDHDKMIDKEVRVRGGGGKTEMRKVPTELPEDKQREFRARVEPKSKTDPTKGVRVYRLK